MEKADSDKLTKAEKKEHKKRKKEHKQQKKEEEKSKKLMRKLEKHENKQSKYVNSLQSSQNLSIGGKKEKIKKDKKLPKIKKNKEKLKRETGSVITQEENTRSSEQNPEILVINQEEDIHIINTQKKNGKRNKLFRKKKGKNDSATSSMFSQGNGDLKRCEDMDQMDAVKLNRGLSVSCACILEVHDDKSRKKKGFIKKKAKKLRNAVSVLSLNDKNLSKSFENHLHPHKDNKSIASSGIYNSCSTINSSVMGDGIKKKKKLAHKIQKTFGKKGTIDKTVHQSSSVIPESVVEYDAGLPQKLEPETTKLPISKELSEQTCGDLQPECSNSVADSSFKVEVDGNLEIEKCEEKSETNYSSNKDIRIRALSDERNRAITRTSSVLVSSKKRLKKKRHKALGGMLKRMKNSKTKTTDEVEDEDEDELIRSRRVTRTASVYRATSAAKTKKIRKEEKEKQKKAAKQKKKIKSESSAVDLIQRPRSHSKMVTKNEKKKGKRKFMLFKKRSNSKKKAEKALIKYQRHQQQELPRKTVEELRNEVEELTNITRNNVMKALEQKDKQINTMIQKSEELNQNAEKFVKVSHQLKKKYQCCCFRFLCCPCCSLPKSNKKRNKIKMNRKEKSRRKKRGSVSSRGSRRFDVVPVSCSLSSSNSSLSKPIQNKSNRSSIFLQAIRQNHDLQSSHEQCLPADQYGESSTSKTGSLKTKFLGSWKEKRKSKSDDEEFLSQFDEEQRESARELLELDRS